MGPDIGSNHGVPGDGKKGRGGASWLAASLLALAACGPDVAPLTMPDAIRSIILERGEALQLIDRAGSPAHPLAPGEDARALLYAAPLEALFGNALPTGRAAPDEPLSEAVPTPDATWSYSADEGAWRPSTPEPLPVVSHLALRCQAAGGCLVAGACSRPCPSPTQPAQPTPPDPPRPLERASCPAGWTAVDHAPGVPGCAPPPLPAARACPGATAPSADGGCAPVGTACDAYAAWVPPGRPVVMVVPGDLARAAAESAADAVLVLSPGTWSFDGRLQDDRLLLGACASGTTLRGRVSVRGRAAIANLTLVTEQNSAIDVQRDGDVTLRGVVIESARGYGVTVEAATLRADQLVIRGSTTSGVILGNGSRGELRGVVVDGGAGYGVNVVRSRAWLHDLHVRGLRATPSGVGAGLLVASASVTLSRGDFDDNAGGGILTDGSSLAVDGLRVRGGLDATGLFLRLGSTASVSAASFEGLGGTAIRVDGGSRASLVDVSVDGAHRGAEVDTNSALTMTRAHLRRTIEEGVLAEAGPATLHDLVASELYPDARDRRAALVLGPGSSLRHGYLRLGQGTGVALDAAAMRDVTLVGSMASTTERTACGVSVGGGGGGIERVRLLGWFEHGIEARDAAVRTVGLVDVDIDAVVMGDALRVRGCSALDGERVRIGGTPASAVQLGQQEEPCAAAHRLKDLTLSGFTKKGLELVGPATLTLEKASIRGEGSSIVLGGSLPAADISDLRAEHVSATAGDAVKLELTRFELAGADFGVTLEAPDVSGSALTHGRITGNGLQVRASPSAREVLRAGLDTVHGTILVLR